jgi:hypothetical protein
MPREFPTIVSTSEPDTTPVRWRHGRLYRTRRRGEAGPDLSSALTNTDQARDVHPVRQWLGRGLSSVSFCM